MPCWVLDGLRRLMALPLLLVFKCLAAIGCAPPLSQRLLRRAFDVRVHKVSRGPPGPLPTRWFLRDRDSFHRSDRLRP
eukprot:7695238-Pyramimonas_sp.AAC.1